MPRIRLGGWLGLAVLAFAACRQADHRVLLLELGVTDLARAVSFYGAVFGWEATRPDSSYAILDAKPIAIGLVVRDSVTAGGPTIVIGAQDLELILARIVPSGGVLREPIAPSWRGRQFRFVDPDGNELVVWSERTAPRNPKTP